VNRDHEWFPAAQTAAPSYVSKVGATHTDAPKSDFWNRLNTYMEAFYILKMELFLSKLELFFIEAGTFR
jgi:hypothetical protein